VTDPAARSVGISLMTTHIRVTSPTAFPWQGP
jgi:hypothetical protein